MIQVTRIIVLTYVNEDVYNEDRAYWNLPDAGHGHFGSSKRWTQTIKVEEV